MCTLFSSKQLQWDASQGQVQTASTALNACSEVFGFGVQPSCIVVRPEDSQCLSPRQQIEEFGSCNQVT